MARRKKRYRGHYCWVCSCILPNEAFSGKGHSRHVCKKCAKLGPEELAVIQGRRDIDRCLRDGLWVRRKCRKTFEAFLSHPNPRIREYALEVKEEADQARRLIYDEYYAGEGPNYEDGWMPDMAGWTDDEDGWMPDMAGWMADEGGWMPDMASWMDEGGEGCLDDDIPF